LTLFLEDKIFFGEAVDQAALFIPYCGQDVHHIDLYSERGRFLRPGQRKNPKENGRP
jgi:hypothetical protein